MLLLFFFSGDSQQVQRIDESLDRCTHRIGVGRKTVHAILSVANAHVHAPHIVAAAVHRLNQKLRDQHFFLDKRFDRPDGSIDRTVTGTGSRSLHPSDFDDDGSRRHERSRKNLKIFQFQMFLHFLSGRIAH